MLNGVEDMAYKNKKTKHRGKATLFITTIAMLNLFGVSYAFWEDEITMFVEISTANFEVAFDKKPNIDNVDISYDEENRKLIINANIEENMEEIITETENEIRYSAQYSEFEGKIPFTLVNKGDVGVECTYKNINTDNGLELDLIDVPYSLEPMESAEDPYLYIKAGEGTYNFEIELQYSNKY